MLLNAQMHLNPFKLYRIKTELNESKWSTLTRKNKLGFMIVAKPKTQLLDFTQQWTWTQYLITQFYPKLNPNPIPNNLILLGYSGIGFRSTVG